MSNHTPGPWTVQHGTNIRGVRNDTGSFGGVANTAAHGSNAVDCDPENRANAHLIAAAPDLLEACKGYLDAMDRYGHPDKTDRLMRAAIEKATGEN